MTPAGLRTQMFGFYALAGKATAFPGPLLVGTATYGTGSQRLGLGIIVVFFTIGLLMMLTVPGD